ncbi:MAG: chemotaxis protein CheW [Magnetococcales bacterium]|nr:chemotaxis protein CheW [Magnetococcales bacterium]
MSEEDDALIAMFVQESTEHLDTIEPDLLILEEQGKDTDPAVVNRMFRGVHTIKGTSGFFGLSNISNLSHTMENLLGKIRENVMVPTAEVTDSLLAGMDKLTQMIEDVPNSESIDASQEKAVIQALLDGSGGGDGAAAKPKAEEAAQEADQGATEAEAQTQQAEEEAEETTQLAKVEPDPQQFPILDNYPEEVQDAIKTGKYLYVIDFKLKGNNSTRQDSFKQFEQLIGPVGTLIATNPIINDELNFLSCKDDILQIFVSTVLDLDLVCSLTELTEKSITQVQIPKSAIKKKEAEEPTTDSGGLVAVGEVYDEVEDEDDEPTPTKRKLRLLNEKLSNQSSSGNGDGIAVASKSAAKQPVVEETLRVSVSLLDELINMAGELVLIRNQLSRTVSTTTSNDPQAPLIQSLDSITSRIQAKVMHARMQQINVVFSKFPRVVRDLANKMDKKITLELRGGEVELDKSVIQHLSDPLTHMIRNVVDHGIELPDIRKAAGKPVNGQVQLAAYHENGMVNIAMIDDGAGIDAEKIKRKAIDKGLITNKQAENMGEEDALALIFAPGFSMAKKVSDVSGRGVGMDVVRTNIEKLRGSVQITSKVGAGTNITLKLPLTLAIIPAMIISVRNHRFAIPEIGLVKIVRVVDSELEDQIQMVYNAPVLRMQDMLLPLVDLADVLEMHVTWPEDSDKTERRARWLHRQVNKNSKKGNPVDGKERRAKRNKVIYIMVINIGGNKFGMVVDNVLDSEEIVVKPLPSYFKENTCFSATTILGDGSVALIIDYAGIMEKANINFGNIEQSELAKRQGEMRSPLHEKQNIIILETGSGLRMGILTRMVRRVEKIRHKDIDLINDNHYVRYTDKTYRIILPGQVLGLEYDNSLEEVIEDENKELCMVISNIPGLQAGLVFAKIVDTMDTYIDLDQQAIQAQGLYGSARLDEHVVLFPNITELFNMVEISAPPPESIWDGAGLKAIVVDDTLFSRLMTTSYLTQADFDVTQAKDGETALELLKEEEFDIMVTDLNMPGMSGFDLVKETRETNNSEIPIIATTLFSSKALEFRCGQAGMVGCVPIMDKVRLMNIVESLKRQ